LRDGSLPAAPPGGERTTNSTDSRETGLAGRSFLVARGFPPAFRPFSAANAAGEPVALPAGDPRGAGPGGTPCVISLFG